MSLNELTTATGFMPLARSSSGQLFYISPNQNQPCFSYLLPRPYSDAFHSIQQPQPIQHQLIQHQQHQLLPTSPKPTQPTPQTKDQTNAKVRNIKEKCISHFIDGQLIIETPKPLAEKKLKKSKKNKHHQQNNSTQNSITHSLNSPLPSTSSPVQQQHNSLIQLHAEPNLGRNKSPVVPTPVAISSPLALPQIVQKQQVKQVQIRQQPQANHKVQQSNNHAQNNVKSPTTPKQTQQKQQLKKEDNDIQKIRAEMPNWSVDEVARFIERHEDIKQYSHKFREDEVDGKALLLMIDRNLNFQILTSMFKHGPAMKIEATLSKYKLND